jgi:hypothetical protein
VFTTLKTPACNEDKVRALIAEQAAALRAELEACIGAAVQPLITEAARMQA